MESIYSSLNPAQKVRADEAWSDFGNMWLSSDAKSKAFVVEYFIDELGFDDAECKILLDELNLVHKRRVQKHRQHTHTFVKSDIKLSDAFGENLDEAMTDSASVRHSMVENLVRIKYARERKILFDETIDLAKLDAVSLKVSHPRLYLSAVNDVESLLKGIEPVDRILIVNQVSSGVVQDVVKLLKQEGSQSVTSLIRLMGKRYGSWQEKVRSTLEWLQHQGLVYRVGAKRYSFKNDMNHDPLPELSALEQKILLFLGEDKSGKTFTKICRDLGFINYPHLRESAKQAVFNLEDRGYVIRGAYNRIIRRNQ